MSRSPTDQAAHALGKTLRDGRPHAEQTPRKPQDESLKRHGDELQDAVDKATGVLGKPD